MKQVFRQNELKKPVNGNCVLQWRPGKQNQIDSLYVTLISHTEENREKRL